MPERSLDLRITTEVFETHGWGVHLITPDSPHAGGLMVPTQPNNDLRCMDERYGVMEDGTRDFDLIPNGPAFPGAIKGVTAMFNGYKLRNKLEGAMACIEGLGFKPGIHGSAEDAIRGCAFVAAMIDGSIPGSAPVSEEQIRGMLRLYGDRISNTTLHGSHTASTLVFNTVRDQTIKPNGEAFIMDVWLGGAIGLNQTRMTNAIAPLATKLLGNQPERNLYLVVES